ncbi:MAG: hypothetical protein LAP85_24980 [Acidobacteriia bacterium]|nr:hypothetical protein [Terriglobia bacterium]
MDAEGFVAAIRVSAMRSAADGTIANMNDPPGRRPAPELVALGNWYRALPASDREMVQHALLEAAHAAVFGVFAILDGARRVDPAQPPVEFELWHVARDGRIKLNGDLHNILNSEPWW